MTAALGLLVQIIPSPAISPKDGFSPGLCPLQSALLCWESVVQGAGGGFLGWRLVCAALSSSPAGAAHVSSMLLVQALPAQDCNLLEQRSLLTPP